MCRYKQLKQHKKTGHKRHKQHKSGHKRYKRRKGRWEQTVSFSPPGPGELPQRAESRKPSPVARPPFSFSARSGRARRPLTKLRERRTTQLENRSKYVMLMVIEYNLDILFHLYCIVRKRTKTYSRERARTTRVRTSRYSK